MSHAAVFEHTHWLTLSIFVKMRFVSALSEELKLLTITDLTHATGTIFSLHFIAQHQGGSI